MREKIESIRDQIAELKAAKGTRTKIPDSFFKMIEEYSHQIPLKDICNTIGIDLQNTQRRIGKMKGASNNNKMIKTTKLIQLPGLVGGSPIMEMSLPSGVVITVYTS